MLDEDGRVLERAFYLDADAMARVLSGDLE